MHAAFSPDGTRIVVEPGGSGPPLVVVNGAFSDRGSVAPFRPYLEPHFTVIGYDRRGRGDSGNTPPYAPEREIEDLAAVIESSAAPAFVYTKLCVDPVRDASHYDPATNELKPAGIGGGGGTITGTGGQGGVPALVGPTKNAAVTRGYR